MSQRWWQSGLWFGVVGASAAAVHLLVFELTRHAVLPELANLAGFLVAFGVSFVGHRWLSFKGTSTGLQQSLWRFAVTAVSGFCHQRAVFCAGLARGGLAAVAVFSAGFVAGSGPDVHAGPLVGFPALSLRRSTGSSCGPPWPVATGLAVTVHPILWG